MSSRDAATVSLGSLDPTWATFLLSTFVLAGGIYLTSQALKSKNQESAKLVFTAVGVLFGLLAAGGLGTLFAKQAADSAASSAATSAAAKVAPKAATAAANQVSGEVTEQVESALEASPGGGSGGASSPKAP